MEAEPEMIAIRQSLKDAVDLFSSGSDRKQEREKWVVREFLSNLKVSFIESDLENGPFEPVDVKYKDALFQVKEIMSENYHRLKEYKEAYQKSLQIKTVAEWLEQSEMQDVKHCSAFELAFEQAKKHTKKYGSSSVGNIDLLLYMNNINCRPTLTNPEKWVSEVSGLGWRSVSFLLGRNAIIMHANQGAPQFLIKNVYG